MASEQSDCGPSCGCGSVSRSTRRDFLAAVGLSTVAALSSRLAVAGPFETSDFARLVPEDKKLSADWIKSLFDRGTPSVYRGADLKYIGMPVGGLTTGELYLGGDGRLWRWDIFNQTRATGDKGYAHPDSPNFPVEQGFSLKIGDQSRMLDSSDFPDVSFSGQYPIGTVNYTDPACPLVVTLDAFSPFIPLNVDDSGLPVTILRFTLRNTSAATVQAALTGKLQNAVCLSHPEALAVRRNARIDSPGMTFLECSVEKPEPQKTSPIANAKHLEDLKDFGTMGLALLGAPADAFSGEGVGKLNEKMVGELTRLLKLDPGQSVTVDFVLAWHFPNLSMDRIKASGRYYATLFKSARDIAEHVTKNFQRLTSQTKLWRDTWYDSTLPYWLLDRSFLNISILATSTAFRFSNGRFYGWEGVGCCGGTCTHVWQYEQAMGRLFPELDILLRERADFDPAIGFHADGMIDHRGELHAGQAVDGQAGTILRAYRDYQMSPDDQFLQRNYTSIKKAMQWMIAQEGNGDGILEGAQHNTLDTEWYGPVAWLSGLYLAALRAAAEMAGRMHDDSFAKQCSALVAAGVPNLVRELFNGEYFINKPDPTHPQAINSGSGCEIDQVMGQSWAFQVGLGRLLPEEQTRSALRSLWKYNFTPDVGPYRQANKPGRWYAMPGEAGLLMCTFPRSDWNYQKSSGKGPDWAAGYFNECMNGFEHQVAGHMIWEGMVMEGLAIERAIHERYGASRRNPWNEIECGDHYARSMASYGVFTAACGYEYDGPAGRLGFAPRLTPENFKAAFTAARGWGTFQQQIIGGQLSASLQLKYGRLHLSTLSLVLPAGAIAQNATATLDGAPLPAQLQTTGSRLSITFVNGIDLRENQILEVKFI